MTTHQPIQYAGRKFRPIPAFDKFFAKKEKELLILYTEYCKDLEYNVPLSTFLYSLYQDVYYTGAVNLS